jgi:hypothetical protein
MFTANSCKHVNIPKGSINWAAIAQSVWRWAIGRTLGVRFQAGARIFSSSTSRLAVRPAQSPIKWDTEPLFPGLKRPEREVDRSPPSNAKVKNDRDIPPRPNNVFMDWCLIKHCDNFIFQGSIKDSEFLEQLSDYKLLNEGSVAWKSTTGLSRRNILNADGFWRTEHTFPIRLTVTCFGATFCTVGNNRNLQIPIEQSSFLYMRECYRSQSTRSVAIVRRK